MCGICGKVAFDRSARTSPRLVRDMMATLAHRGPDGEGIYDGGQAVLGHTRLAIIDLSTGQQPMSNEDETVWIVFNGEIYNFEELTSDLIQRGHRFRTSSDTETIVHLYEEYDIDLLQRLRGMFAFAIWDARRRRLFLARDRVGIKPLYYASTGDALLVGSEMKALLADPALDRTINYPAIDTFLRFQYLPGRHTLFRSVEKLEPGHYLTLEDGEIKVSEYWDLPPPVKRYAENISRATDDLVELIRETTRAHMVSDVPVGVLLSGGVDSSALLSFAVEETDKDVHTFTVGFEDESFADERPYARLVAKRYSKKHVEISISAEEFRDFLPRYVWHMEEPVCEPPAIALYYVTRVARQYVKVLISGEGGDEAFGGYQNYRNFLWLERLKKWIGPARPVAAAALQLLAKANDSERIRKYVTAARLPQRDYYLSRTSGPSSPFCRLRGPLYTSEFKATLQQGAFDTTIAGYVAKASASSNALDYMLYLDFKTWLPNDLLVKADKMTMANSVELRVPFLDHEVLQFAALLPANWKVRGITTKYILKRALRSRVPREILQRRKTGFPLPYARWLSTEMRDYVRDVLLDRRSRDRGYFHETMIDSMLNRRTLEDRSAEVFSLLALELWHREFADNVQSAVPVV